MTNAGPLFELVDTVESENIDYNANLGARKKPLLVKGAVRAWPAWNNWTFERLAALRYKDGSEPIFKFQNGLLEQGSTRVRPHLPVSPYIRELADAAKHPHANNVGLVSDDRLRQIKPGDPFTLNWDHLRSFTPDRLYLAQWSILDEFPDLRNDFAIRKIWPGLRWTWESVFIGPANTVTGLHTDFPHNWLCQVRGVKEVLLFPPDQDPKIAPSSKYDWGAELSSIDITQMNQQSEVYRRFNEAKGIYARLEPGDALFIPKCTWHAVVALEPSISLAIFGLNPFEIIFEGGFNAVKTLLHKMRLYRWGNCTCHHQRISLE
jgi:hypothetical protein